MKRLLPLLCVVTMAGWLAACSEQNDAADTAGNDRAAEPGTRHGAGNGTGGGSGKQDRRADCGEAIELFRDRGRVWRKDDAALKALEGMTEIEYTADRSMTAIHLAALLRDAGEYSNVEIRACGPKTFNAKHRQVEQSTLYLMQGRGGRWKLVDMPGRTPNVLLRGVTSITALTDSAAEADGADKRTD